MYDIFTFTEAGGHVANEDFFLVESHPDDASCCIFALADGQGGRVGGREAAEIACRKTIEIALSCSPQQLARPTSWPTILCVADEAVQQSPQAGFTTLVAACVTESTVCGASSGDSAVIFDRGLQGHQILTENQIKDPPVGSGFAVFLPFSSSLKAHWLLLLMSDGVWKYAGWDTIIALMGLNDGQDVIDSLQDAARLPGSGEFQDDFTVIAVKSR